MFQKTNDTGMPELHCIAYLGSKTIVEFGDDIEAEADEHLEIMRKHFKGRNLSIKTSAKENRNIDGTFRQLIECVIHQDGIA
ncbi:MAG: hypothetical protein GF309_10400 [Candidatus Lokiarchaeota archaeon]|nr:hypothetical protein [Candidatus Lokiarchaeota archaeon]